MQKSDVVVNQLSWLVQLYNTHLYFFIDEGQLQSNVLHERLWVPFCIAHKKVRHFLNLIGPDDSLQSNLSTF